MQSAHRPGAAAALSALILRGAAVANGIAARVRSALGAGRGPNGPNGGRGPGLAGSRVPRRPRLPFLPARGVAATPDEVPQRA
jgi:hypothetical protein